MLAGPGVEPGERDADDDDAALEDDPQPTGVDQAPPEVSPSHENRAATTSVAPDALDDDSATDD